MLRLRLDFLIVQLGGRIEIQPLVLELLIQFQVAMPPLHVQLWMMKPAIELQEQGEAFLFIANYHALTSVHEGAALREMTRDVALDFLACGIDPERTAFYRQSDVPEVHELAWLLSVLTPMGY